MMPTTTIDVADFIDKRPVSAFQLRVYAACLAVATLLFGGCTMITPLASTLGQLAVLRFVTGLGLGGVLPNLTSLVTEFAPRRLRGRLTTLAFSGLPFGSMVAGLLASWLIPTYGWPSLFYVGGLLPLVIGIVAMVSLPESIRFLALRGGGSTDAIRILRQLAPRETIPEHV